MRGVWTNAGLQDAMAVSSVFLVFDAYIITLGSWWEHNDSKPNF